MLSHALEALARGGDSGSSTLPDWARANTLTGEAQEAYAHRLPSELRRAAPEIYKSLRAEGVTSCRSWLKDNYSGYKGAGSQWVDLWTTAAQLDMAIGGCRSDQEIQHILNTDDRIEVGLRHLGAYMYESRTKDRTGAAMMRAVTTPGFGKDIIPSWLVQDATQHSKMEHQRNERVEQEMKRRNQSSDKGKGKGKDAKGKQKKSE